jgi:hypothetical protein
MDLRKMSLKNADKALKFAWKVAPGFCRSDSPPKNIPICKTPMKAPCCCACPPSAKLTCMDECLEAEKYEDGDEDAQKVSMAYCGFACQSCKWEHVPKGGAEPSALSETPANGDAETPPAWWLSTMTGYLKGMAAHADVTL